MELDKNLLKEFARITNDSGEKTQSTYLRGTVVENSGGKYVQIDGSTTSTPIAEIVDVEDGDRVLVSIENHRATIIGNFSYPPSARKEQQALDQAGAAQESASSANNLATSAQQKAETAIEQSSIASVSAAEAKEQATGALNKATEANNNVQEAKTLATQASADATEAKTQAAESHAASSLAQSEVARLEGEVTDAKTNANAALEQLHTQAGEIDAIKETYSTKVELENTTAELTTEITKQVGQLETTVSETYATKTENVELEGKLQSQITQNAEGLASQVSKTEKLEADTAVAIEYVNDSLAKAEAAEEAADQAESNADAAQQEADEATANANASTEQAQVARNAADQARQAADAADKTVQSAQSDLAEAQENYQNVANKDGVTEEELAEAQALVDTAQTAVNDALAEAAEADLAATQAEEAAIQAEQEAETARGVAATAQQKASNAQTAASNARIAAEIARKDVAALTQRITTAETSITQNSESIVINANKTDEIGNDLKNNYYTKNETDAKIEVQSDRITSTVTKVETVEKNAIVSTIEEFYLSESPTELIGGSWSREQPVWTEGMYIWRRSYVTKGDGSSSYQPSQNGVCITGNHGEDGALIVPETVKSIEGKDISIEDASNYGLIDPKFHGETTSGENPTFDNPIYLESIEDEVFLSMDNNASEERSAVFPLESTILMEGSYLADDGIHHTKRRLSLPIADMNSIEEQPGWVEPEIIKDFDGKSNLLFDASSDKLVDIIIHGETTQVINEGKNIFDLSKVELEVPTNDTYESSLLENGIRVKATSFEAIQIMTAENIVKDFKPSTSYICTAKLKVISVPTQTSYDTILGFGRGFTAVQPPILTAPNIASWVAGETYELESMFTTPSTLDDLIMDISVTAGGEYELTEIMIREATETDPTYVPYGTSPSFDQPSELNSIEDSVSITVTNQDPDNPPAYPTYDGVDDNYLYPITSDLTYVGINLVDGVSCILTEPVEYMQITFPEDVGVGYHSEIIFTASHKSFGMYIEDEDYDLTYVGDVGEDGYPFFDIRESYHLDFIYDDTGFRCIVGNRVYEQTVTFPLESTVLMKGSYLDDDGIHYNRRRFSLLMSDLNNDENTPGWVGKEVIKNFDGKNFTLTDSSDSQLIDINIHGETVQAVYDGKNRVNLEEFISSEYGTDDVYWRRPTDTGFTARTGSDGGYSSLVPDDYAKRYLKPDTNYIVTGKCKLTNEVSTTEVDVLIGCTDLSNPDYLIYIENTDYLTVNEEYTFDFVFTTPSDLENYKFYVRTKGVALEISEFMIREETELDDSFSLYRVDAYPTLTNPSNLMSVKGSVYINVTGANGSSGLQAATFPLESTILMEGSYLADDGIHHTRRRLSLPIANMNISETNPGWVTDMDNDIDLSYLKTDYPDMNGPLSDITNYVTNICLMGNEDISINIDTTGNGSITLERKDGTVVTQTEYKTLYPDLVVEIEYELPSEIVIPYTTDQEEAWEQITSLYTYNLVTTMTSNARLMGQYKGGDKIAEFLNALRLDYPDANGLLSDITNYDSNICLSENGCISIDLTGDGVVLIQRSDGVTMTQTEYKTLYPDLVVEIEYELPSEVITPYSETQQKAWDEIVKFRTYNPRTNISSNARLTGQYYTYYNNEDAASGIRLLTDLKKDYPDVRGRLSEFTHYVSNICLDNPGDIYINTDYEPMRLSIYRADGTELTQTEYKTLYPDLVVEVEYELPEEIVVPYTETQQKAWDEIKNLSTYNPETNVTSNARLTAQYYTYYKGDRGDQGIDGLIGINGTTGVSLANGKSLYKDVVFQNSYNSCEATDDVIELSKHDKSIDNPYEGAGYEIVIKSTGAGFYGWGGVNQTIESRANAIFVRRIIAKIPVGYKLEHAEGVMGTGYESKWLTSNEGTGKFEEYMFMYECGSTKPFEKGGRMYISGGTEPSPENPLIWYMASCETYDITTIPLDPDNLASNEDLSAVEDNLNDRINQTQSVINQLSSMISHLVTDENGGSLMTQTPDGWTFNMSSINGNLKAIEEAMENMESANGSTKSALEKLSDLVNDVAKKTAYITIGTDSNGDPCIELGKTDNLFKVRITNTAIDFLEGSTRIAYANNNTFYSEKIITKELQIDDGPGFVWRRRANGNLGLTYISG